MSSPATVPEWPDTCEWEGVETVPGWRDPETGEQHMPFEQTVFRVETRHQGMAVGRKVIFPARLPLMHEYDNLPEVKEWIREACRIELTRTVEMRDAIAKLAEPLGIPVDGSILDYLTSPKLEGNAL